MIPRNPNSTEGNRGNGNLSSAAFSNLSHIKPPTPGSARVSRVRQSGPHFGRTRPVASSDFRRPAEAIFWKLAILADSDDKLPAYRFFPIREVRAGLALRALPGTIMRSRRPNITCLNAILD